MRLVRSATEVLERIYDVELPGQQWVESVRDASVSCFDGIMDAQAYLFKVGPEGSFQCHEMASDPEMRRSFDEAHALAAPALIRKLYQSCPVVRLPQALTGATNKTLMNLIIPPGDCGSTNGIVQSALLGAAGNLIGAAVTAKAGVEALEGLAGRTEFFEVVGKELSLAEELADAAARGEAAAAYNAVVESVTEGYSIVGTVAGTAAADVLGEM